MSAPTPDLLCIGSVLWDLIGRTDAPMRLGNDVPGRISRVPGGVAMNIAITLRELGLTPALLTAIGRDAEGDDLVALCQRLGMVTDFVHRAADLPTDRYMAIEGAGGLVAAIADARSLEAAGDAILAPLSDGRLGRADAPYPGIIALDGNLTEALLSAIAGSVLFSKADLRIAPASPGKAARLRSLLQLPNATLYVNLEEAVVLCGRTLESSADAAAALVDVGCARVCVTDGARAASKAAGGEILTAHPPRVAVARVTGAGDAFMAAHIVAEVAGAGPAAALDQALAGAAAHVSSGGAQ